MKVFVTEYPRRAGPDIEAETWEEAEEKASTVGVNIVGILDSRYQGDACQRDLSD